MDPLPWVGQPARSKVWVNFKQSLAFQFQLAGGLLGLTLISSFLVLFKIGHASFSAFILVPIGFFCVSTFLLFRIYVSISGTQLALTKKMTSFQEKLTELHKMDELKSDFFSTVSHELRTPLTSIGGYTRLLARGDAGELNPTQKEFLEIIESNVRRLADLVSDVLDVEKIEAGVAGEGAEIIDLIEVLKECAESFRPIAQAKGLDFRVRLGEQPLFIFGMRSRLMQIFSNLISNAIKYTQAGFVEVSAQENNFLAKIQIADSGVGIAPQDQQKVFDKFYRTVAAERSEVGGTGLGLSIVRGLVEAQGGRIQLVSQLHQGSVFSVFLPTAQVTEKGEGPDYEYPLFLQRRGPIFVLGEGIAEIPGVFEAGREVRRIQDLGALDEATRSLPALWVIDGDQYSLSSISGALRSGSPCLVLGSQIDASTALANGAAAFLKKPLLWSAFHCAVNDLLQVKGGKILLADPHTDLRLLMKRSLEQSGFQVDDVDHGAQILRRLVNEKYDLVLIDLNLPDVSGEELLKAIRKDSRGNHVPVFVMLDEESRRPLSRERLLALGADQFVGKCEGIGGVAEAVLEYLAAKRVHESEAAI